MALCRVEVIKRQQVQLVGAVHLSAGSLSAPVRQSTPGRTAPSAEPIQARIVESNNEYAIIEIVCSCGCKTHIQCNYANVGKG